MSETKGNGSAGADSPIQWLSRPVDIVVEVRVRASAVIDQAEVDRLVSEAVASRPTLQDGPLPCNKELGEFVSSVKVCGIADSFDKENVTSGYDDAETDCRPSTPPFIPFYRVDAHIVQYKCIDEDGAQPNLPTVPFSSVTRMPSSKMDELWDSLKFGANPVKERLLAYLSSGNLFRKLQVRSSVVNWHGIVLLHGPAGTGKTTLCRSLAQKLAIRSRGGIHPKPIYLVEVQSSALYSQYFGQSEKNVYKTFDSVSKLAAEAQHVFILLDEVESLAPKRAENSGSDGQPGDALRSVNALLTSLDALREVQNVTVLSTSNLIQRIDPAFLDRVDVHEQVPQPGFSVRRSIISEVVDELKKAGVLEKDKEEKKEELLENLLRDVVRETKGLSGRALRKLPLIAHAEQMRGVTKKASTEQFLGALKKAATRARKGNNAQGNT